MQSPAALRAGEGGSGSAAVERLYPQIGCIDHPEKGMSIDPAQLKNKGDTHQPDRHPATRI
ncbi:hypothetical protein D3C85_388860 [compost metagenome]